MLQRLAHITASITKELRVAMVNGTSSTGAPAFPVSSVLSELVDLDQRIEFCKQSFAQPILTWPAGKVVTSRAHTRSPVLFRPNRGYEFSVRVASVAHCVTVQLYLFSAR